jgi:hypothetical protein
MPDTITGPGTKKETVYSGPGPQARQTPTAASYNGMPPGTTGTIYNGPTGGTVYNGPAAGSTASSPSRPNTPSQPVQAAPNTGGAKGGVTFFLIAGFSAINTLLILASAPFVLAIGLAATRVRAGSDLGPVLLLNAVVIGAFVVIGIFAMKGSKAAFLIGLLLYSGDTVLLLLSDNAAVHLPSIVVHGIFLFSIFKAFRQLES